MRLSPTLDPSLRSRSLLALPLLAALACAACGPSPELQSVYSADRTRIRYTTTEEVRLQEGQTAYVYIGAPPPAAPEPAVVARPENPFAFTRTWVGEYDCPQGITEMTLRVIGVRGERVDAVYEFHHAATGAAGSYHISGHFDPGSRRVSFSPGAWIERPPNYVTVGLEGRIDGSRFQGRITHPRCGGFSLRASK